MARYKIPYPGLNDSLKHLRTQVIHSLPYTVKNLPKFNTPQEVFKFCKSNYTFKNDPPGVELFQTVPTLLHNNDIGSPGEGDCDDATIFCLTELLNSGFTDIGIVLTGKNKNLPSHIYCYCDYKGQRQILDLTNKNFNQERPYPFKQFIPFKISKTQLDMFLQLADSGNRNRRKPRLKILTEAQKQKAVFLPSKNVFIPVHKFDQQPIRKVKQTLLSEGYDPEQIAGYLGGRAERKAKKKQKAENKQVKFETKQSKKSAKTDVIKAKAEKKSATAEKKRSSGRAKETRAEAKKIKEERRESGGGMEKFQKFAKVAKTFIPGGEEETEEEETEDTSAIDVTDQEEETPSQEEETQTDETDLQEGFADLGKADLLNAGLFALGFFLEKTKKVA